MKRTLLLRNVFILCMPSILFNASIGYSAAENKVVLDSSATIKSAEQGRKAGRLREKLNKINDAALAGRAESREALAELESKIQGDINALDVDRELVKAARDKSLDWRTRYLLINRAGRKFTWKKISRDEEIGLYSDALLDAGEHKEVRRLAAESLMEPARKEGKARETLAKAAKDKNMPGEVLQSVMVSVGYAGMDDAEILSGLMNRKPKTNNDIGINLNAVRALGKSKDPRAIGMLFKILDESQPDSFFQVTALGEFSGLLKNPATKARIQPMLTPRLLKLLNDRSYIGASRQTAGGILLMMNEKKAIPHIIKWLKPKSEGGGSETDAVWAAEFLAEFGDKGAVAPIEELLKNFATDARWMEILKNYPEYTNGTKRFPEDYGGYEHIQECLKKLKGLPYEKSKLILPWGDLRRT